MFKDGYDYLPLDGMDNVFAEASVTRDVEITYVVDSHIRPLITRLSGSRKKWTLIGTRMGAGKTNNARTCTRFEVWQDNEMLGVIEREYRGGHYCYGITNPRIAGKLTRGNQRFTKDEKKAVQIIYGSFSPKSPSEAMLDATKALSNKMQQQESGKRHAWERCTNHFAPQVVCDFLASKWPEVLEAMRTAGMDAKGIAKVTDAPEHYAAYKDYLAMTDAQGKNKGTSILIRGDDYIVRTNQENVVLSTSAISDELKEKLAMLKLQENNTMLPGVGFKLNASTFYIVT